jgi:hypothetical protein
MQRTRAFVLCVGAMMGAIGCGDGGTDTDAGPETETDAPTPSTCPAPTAGPTHHSNDLLENEIWTADASPHIVDRTVRVRNGMTLEIEPCAVVQLAADQGITVAFPITPNTGTLLAEGTAERPIRFEGLDGARWGYVFVQAPGTARLAYVTLEGGGAIDGHGATLIASGDGYLPVQTPLYVDHVTVRRSLGTGVVVNAVGRFADGSRDLVVTDSGNSANPYPLVVSEHAIEAIPLGAYTGNATDKVVIDTERSIEVDVTMRNLGVPYMVADGNDLRVASGVSESPATLTIEPGVRLEFSAGRALHIERFLSEEDASGALVAIGTEDEEIVFTSSAPSPQPGDWVGLWFGGVVQPTTRLEHVRIEYAGADCGCILVSCSDVEEYDGAIVMAQMPPSVFLHNSTIADSRMHGVVLGYQGPMLDFRTNNWFEDIAGCPVTESLYDECPDPRRSCSEGN